MAARSVTRAPQSPLQQSQRVVHDCRIARSLTASFCFNTDIATVCNSHLISTTINCVDWITRIARECNANLPPKNRRTEEQKKGVKAFST